MTQMNLGSALARLGEGTERLEEAVSAYREALKERTRERVPLDWDDDVEQSRRCAFEPRRARERHGKARRGGLGLPRGAKERTRERVPLDWATSTGNQGVAMMHLAERKKIR
jgi:hypothetical protein